MTHPCTPSIDQGAPICLLGPISQMVYELMMKFSWDMYWNYLENNTLSSHFAHAMTAELLSHVQNWDLIGSLDLKLKQTKFFATFQL